MEEKEALQWIRKAKEEKRIYFSPVIGAGLFALTYWVWTLGVNSYTGTGS